MDFRLYTFSDLAHLNHQQIRAEFGGKAVGLYEAYRIGLPVPTTWLISSHLFEKFLKEKGDPADWIRKICGEILSSLPEKKYAVRSSAQGEDSSHHSFAGVFESVLNVELKDLPEAIGKVWLSSFQERSLSYQDGQSRSLMGVVLQPMIEAKYAGICFSKHPSPSTFFENGQIIVEFAPASGEEIVQGSITPYRLSGTVETLSSAAEMKWVDELLDAVLKIRKNFHREADIEFAVDESEVFWLLQDRPISKIVSSPILDLSSYKRMYKRALLALDIGFLIEGCSLFLAPYLEIPFNLERWMVMTTDAKGVQELWVDELLNDAIDDAIRKKIEKEDDYLDKLLMRYADHFRRLTNIELHESLPLKTRLFRWFEQMTPFGAHYYAPMFVIDALYTLLLREFTPIDPEQAENDLFEWTRTGISSLFDLLEEDLRKRPSLKECAKLADKFGFLKCRQIFEEPYSADELYEMSRNLPAKEKLVAPDFSHFEQKYLKSEKAKRWIESLRQWMRIRNQEMEYLIAAYIKTRPLQLQACQELGISLESFWRSSKESLLKGKHREFSKGVSIVRSGGRTYVSDEIQILMAEQDQLTDLKGRTVYGKGKLEGLVQVAFKPEDIQESNTILVTGMTTPDFVPAIRKSCIALITDEGGILCHAAIVAREISIPCVVGTGVATQRLKNGMRVQIDFDRGEIAIL